jgi:hypothetical protein
VTAGPSGDDANPVGRASHVPATVFDRRHSPIPWLAAWSGTYLALAIAATWPVARVLTSHLPHDLGDPLLSLMLLQWNATRVPFTTEWWNGIGFYPLANTLTLSDPRLGASLISTPIIWSTGSAVAGYNVVFVLSYACSALAAHTLVRRLTGSDAAGAIAGCSFGFAPFRSAHLSHLELLLGWWMPVALIAAHGWLEARSRRWLALLAIAIALQGLFAAYYLPMIGVLIALWAMWFAAGRVPMPQLAGLGAAVLLGAAGLVPLFLYYSRVHDALGISRSITEIRIYSADVSSLWSAAPDVRFWPSFAQDNAERYLFPGAAVMLLAIGYACTRRAAAVPSRRVLIARRALAGGALVALAVGLAATFGGPWRMEVGGVRLMVSNFRKPLSLALAALACIALLSDRVRSAVRTRDVFTFYLLAACVMFLLALGPEPTLFGVRVIYKAPYSWLMRAPGFEHSLRAPARFGMVMALALAVAAGLAWQQIASRLRTWPARWLTAVVAAVILAEGWAAPLTVLALPHRLGWPTRCAGLPRLELPMGNLFDDGAAQYRALIDGTRSVNGLSGYIPAQTLALILATRARDADAVAAIAEHGPLCVATDLTHDAAADRWLTAHPLAETLSANSRHAFHFFSRAAPVTRGATAPSIPVTSASSHAGRVDSPLLADGNLATLWSTPERQRPGQYLQLTLACSATVESIELVQEPGRFARRMSIDVSTDGRSWTQAWEGTTGGLVVRSTIRSPVRPWTEFRIGAHAVREIRLRTLATDTDAEWAVAEVLVHGECERQPLAEPHDQP